MRRVRFGILLIVREAGESTAQSLNVSNLSCNGISQRTRALNEEQQH